MNVDISWECDLDWDFLTYCQPAYTFTRLDNPEVTMIMGLLFNLYFTGKNIPWLKFSACRLFQPEQENPD